MEGGTRPKAKANARHPYLPRYDQHLRAAKGRVVELVLAVSTPLSDVDDCTVRGEIREVDTYDLGLLINGELIWFKKSYIVCTKVLQ